VKEMLHWQDDFLGLPGLKRLAPRFSHGGDRNDEFAHPAGGEGG